MKTLSDLKNSMTINSEWEAVHFIFGSLGIRKILTFNGRRNYFRRN